MSRFPFRAPVAAVCAMGAMLITQAASADPERALGWFRASTRHAGLAVGGGPGVRTLGSREKHDFALGTARCGRRMGERWTWTAELFGAAQAGPRGEQAAGGTCFLRHHFDGGGRLLPFAGLGAGLTWTSIREPDLGTGFQFNLAGGFGAHYFYTQRTAVTLEARWFHLSNAGLDAPNRGVNAVLLLGGLTRFY